MLKIGRKYYFIGVRVENQKINNDEKIEISGHFYNFLLDNLEKVSGLYSEIGELKEKIGYFQGRFELANSQSQNIELNSGQIHNEKSDEFIENQIKPEPIQNEPVLIDSEIRSENFLEEVPDESVEKKNKEINSSLRRSGFWMFFVSTGTILANLWIRNFVLLQEELFTLLGVFGPVSIGGLVTVVRPKGPGLIGWLLLFSISISFVLDYFGILNVIDLIL